MRSILILIFSLFFISTNSYAQNDDKAVKLLEVVENRYNAFYSFKGKFEMSIENKEADIAEIQKGNFLVADDKYRIETDILDRITDNETVWTVFKEDEEVQITEFDEEEEEFSPSTIFNIYEEAFTFKNYRDTIIRAQQLHVVDVYPNEEDESFDKVILAIVDKEFYIKYGIVFTKTGSVITYLLDEFKGFGEEETDESLFQYRKEDYEGLDMEEIDLR